MIDDPELLLRRVQLKGDSAYRLASAPVPWADLSGVPALGGGGSPTQVTLTVPAGTRTEHSSVVSDALATATSKVTAALVYGGDSDENGIEELSDMHVFAVPAVGSITFTLTHSRGMFSGPFKINYTLSA